MKRIIVSAMLIASVFSAFSQYSNYNDLGLLIAKDDNYGTARFTAMSGAFGALGSDISSIAINPAGGAMARKSKASVTLGLRSIDADANYYGTTTNTQNEYFNISQAGGMFVFDSHYTKSGWSRFAFTFNYKLKSDFEGSFTSKGNGDYIKFTSFPSKDNTNNYDGGIHQHYTRTTEGKSSEFNIGFSAVHDNKLYVGASLNLHDFDYTEIASLNELNDDKDGNKLDVINSYESYFKGTGFSLGLGLIYKLNQSVRFGLAYETPTWYQEILEDSNIINQDSDNDYNTGFPGKIDFLATDANGTKTSYVTNNEIKKYAYKLRTPSRLTVSGAFVFGKLGLISVDYTYKGYKNTNYNETAQVFLEANQAFSEDYRDAHALNVGTEWRFDKVSLRGGYHYEKNPNLLLGGNTNDDNARGFSVGLGYNFGNATFDLSYYQTENTDYYQLYKLNDLNVNNNTSRITGTLTFNL